MRRFITPLAEMRFYVLHTQGQAILPHYGPRYAILLVSGTRNASAHLHVYMRRKAIPGQSGVAMHEHGFRLSLVP